MVSASLYIPMSQMLHPIDDILLAYCGSCCTLMPITTILFLVSGTICCIVTTRALSIIMFCDSIYFLSLCISTIYFTIGMYSYWLLTMLSIIAVAFGVHILLPLMVYSLADTFGVHILLPLMVYTLANTFGVYILLPLMVYTLADAFSVHILLPSMVYSLANAFGVHILLPSMMYSLADAFSAPILLPSMVYCIDTLVSIQLGKDIILIIIVILLQMHCHLLLHMKDIKNVTTSVLGGHRTRILKYNDISAFISNDIKKNTGIETKEFYYVDYVHKDTVAQYSAECYLELVLLRSTLILSSMPCTRLNSGKVD